MEEMRTFMEEGQFKAVVDATHPYAQMVTSNIKGAMEGMKIPYFRLERERLGAEEPESDIQGKIAWFADNRACARALESVEGNILLTVGTRELGEYCVSEGLRRRIYARVLPAAESLSVCTHEGISGRQIIAMQGPFTTKMRRS